MSVRCIEMLGLLGGDGRIGLYFATADRLANIETLELRVPEIERLVLSGILMRSTKGFGSGPCLESGAALPKRVGCVQGRVFGLGPFQQMELQEPRYAACVDALGAHSLLVEQAVETIAGDRPMFRDAFRRMVVK